MPFFLLPLDCMHQALLDPVEQALGRLRRGIVGQRAQQRHRIDADIFRLRGESFDERRDFGVQFGNGLRRDPLPHQRDLAFRRQLAPLAGFCEHAFCGYQPVRYLQRAGLDRAGEAQEHAAFEFCQFGAEASGFLFRTAGRFGNLKASFGARVGVRDKW